MIIIRYITTNAETRIPKETQIIMWFMFDRMKIEKDYLQIFSLSIKDNKQHILHSQEQPPWSEEILFNSNTPVKEKVYIIKEGDYETMMLAEDY